MSIKTANIENTFNKHKLINSTLLAFFPSLLEDIGNLVL